MFYERSDTEGRGVPNRYSHKTPGTMKEEQRFSDAMKRSEFRPYGPKCGCDDNCGCGCLDNKPCQCHHSSKGCPPHPKSRDAIRTRPDMQSCRLVSASASYGKDRDASDESQEEIRYSHVTNPMQYKARGDNRLPQESNSKELRVDRQPGKMAIYGVEPIGGGRGHTYIEQPSPSCSAGPTLSPNNLPQSYSSVPQGGRISPVCRSCPSAF